MSEETREPQRHTGFLLRRAQQKHVATWQSVISGDTTSVQYGVLAVLDRRPALAQKEICDELDLDRSTVADICSRMEKNGLLSRVQDRQDRRRNVLDLTPAGRAELARLKPLVEEVQVRLTSSLSATELEQLRGLLARLIGD
jgi:DNA-binding MarR family transcriptional regulator